MKQALALVRGAMRDGVIDDGENEEIDQAIESIMGKYGGACSFIIHGQAPGYGVEGEFKSIF